MSQLLNIMDKYYLARYKESRDVNHQSIRNNEDLALGITSNFQMLHGKPYYISM